MFKNKKTSLAGIMMILGVIGKLFGGAGISSIGAEDIGVVIGGIGLITAKDHNVTGGTVSQPTVENIPTKMEKP